MTDAPEQIWANPDHWIEHPPRKDVFRPYEYVQYIRADLVDTLLKQAREDALREAADVAADGAMPEPDQVCDHERQGGRLMAENQDGYLGLYEGEIEVGMTFVWEPNKPHARQVVTVVHVTEPEHDERKIWTSETVWNDESRFREAVVDVTDIIESKEADT